MHHKEGVNISLQLDKEEVIICITPRTTRFKKQTKSHKNSVMKTELQLDVHQNQKQMTSIIKRIKIHNGIENVVWGTYQIMELNIYLVWELKPLLGKT